LRAWLGEDRRVYVYFDNDQKNAAPADARRLIALLGSRGRGATSDRPGAAIAHKAIGH
jgi:uncharacterized protein YecE (DUF72 family)